MIGGGGLSSDDVITICLLVMQFSWGNVFRPIFVEKDEVMVERWWGILTTTRGSTIPTVLVFLLATDIADGNSEMAEIE